MDSKSPLRRGFTLIELLVAISILAIVAMLGWRGLDGIVRSRLALNEDLEQAHGMQLAFAQLQNDCAQIADTMDVGNRKTLITDENRLVVIRYVFADNEPSRAQVVTYRFSNGTLSRNQSVPTRNLAQLDEAWKAALSDSNASEAVPLLSNVTAMGIRLWYPNVQAWSTSGGGPGAGLPNGLEVALKLRGQSSSMVKIFLLGAV
jgi:general secretion pathway protein J